MVSPGGWRVVGGGVGRRGWSRARLGGFAGADAVEYGVELVGPDQDVARLRAVGRVPGLVLGADRHQAVSGSSVPCNTARMTPLISIHSASPASTSRPSWGWSR